MTAERQLEQVTEFHYKIGETVALSPTLLQHKTELDGNLARSLRQIVEASNCPDNSKSQLTLRALMAVEELAEWIEAHNEDYLVAAADAWADRMYLMLDDAVATGLPAEPVLDVVQSGSVDRLLQLHRLRRSSL